MCQWNLYSILIQSNKYKTYPLNLTSSHIFGPHCILYILNLTNLHNMFTVPILGNTFDGDLQKEKNYMSALQQCITLQSVNSFVHLAFKAGWEGTAGGGWSRCGGVGCRLPRFPPTSLATESGWRGRSSGVWRGWCRVPQGYNPQTTTLRNHHQWREFAWGEVLGSSRYLSMVVKPRGFSIRISLAMRSSMRPLLNMTLSSPSLKSVPTAALRKSWVKIRTSGFFWRMPNRRWAWRVPSILTSAAFNSGCSVLSGLAWNRT